MDYNEYQEMQAPGMEFSELVKAAKRRLLPASLMFLIVLLLSVTYALLAPPVYRSSSTILIEQQEIPKDLVRSTVTSFADQRIQMIMQRVLTFSNLSEIIKKYDLYKEERKKNPLEVVIEEMKRDIKHKMISSEVVDPKSGRAMEATLAFSISYNSDNAKTAQTIASELTSLFLSANLKTREDMAKEAEEFLSVEVKRLEKKSVDLEEKLAEFKEANMRQLPELTNLNMSLLDRSQREYIDLNRQVQALEERKIYIEAQLQQQDPSISTVGNGQDITLKPHARAKYLQNRYVSLLASYSENHPDVIRTKRELSNLIGEDGFPRDRDFLEKQIEIDEAQLSAKNLQYGKEHPDIQKLKNSIQLYRDELANSDSNGTGLEQDADNPSYIHLLTTLESIKIDIEYLKENRQLTRNKIKELELALVESPRVEKEYRSLSRDYENTVRKYQEVKAKQLEATLARSLERERKGEKFTLIESPMVSEKPIKPNRMSILMIGVFLAIILSVAFGVLLEKLDQTIKSQRLVQDVFGELPLAVIPHMMTKSDLRSAMKSKILVVVGVIATVGILTVVVHFSYLPIDVVWYMALRKIS